jgi:glycosidase
MSRPLLYEINTRCWLRELSERHGRSITLANVPESEFQLWQRLGFSHIWLMGIWTSGSRARAQALNSSGLARAYSEALPGWTEADVNASPYAVAAYRVSPTLGGESELQAFRRKLQSFGLKLLLDFVPNHLGLDHPWVTAEPDLFVQSANAGPDTFVAETEFGKRYILYGKDPNCPAWTDTVQLDYRRAQTRARMTDLLLQTADLCDGVRCDMAMLLLNDVFANTWKGYPSSEPKAAKEFWEEAISATRKRHPEFLFLAEVYWGLEPRLQSLGFDCTYDKALYDTLVSWSPGAVQRHLLGMPPSCLAASAHFLENHDERRIASILSESEHRAAALIILGLPGMGFIHEGQLSGLRRRLPVQLARRAHEPDDAVTRSMYDRLLTSLQQTAVGHGDYDLLAPRDAWATNPTAQHFVLVQWTGSNSSFDLVVVNLAAHASQCYAPLKLRQTSVASWNLSDLLGTDRFVRRTDEMVDRGLYLDLAANGAQILHFEPVA